MKTIRRSVTATALALLGLLVGRPSSAHAQQHSMAGMSHIMKGALLAFLSHLGVGDSKYHETITRAWVMAVDHFMNQTEACSSCADLIRINPQLLDSKIMLTHYSADVLFSPAARKAFVEPNIQSIPPS